MSRKFGQYYYAAHGRRWGIWLWKEFGSGGIGEFVKDCQTKDEARSEVYRLNGWTEKK